MGGGSKREVDFCGEFGFLRPGGGPVEEAMPGARLDRQQEVGECVYEEERSQETLGREGTHSERRG